MQPEVGSPPYVEDEIMRSIYPWDASSGAGAATKEMLHMRLHKAQAEHMRCIEELRFIPQDAHKAAKHGLYQVHWMAQQLDFIKQDIVQQNPDQHLLYGKMHLMVAQLKHRLAAEASSFAQFQSLLA